MNFFNYKKKNNNNNHLFQESVHWNKTKELCKQMKHYNRKLRVQSM